MTREASMLGNSSAAFAMATALTAGFNTGLSWTKDAYPPLLSLMNRLAGHNWTTQGLTDLIFFLAAGLILRKTCWADKIAPNHLIVFLALSVVASGVGLFVWYALF